MKARKVCVVTGTRAEYGLFYPVMQKIQKSNVLELQIIATTMHYSKEFGLTYKQIEANGFKINEKIENLIAVDSKSGNAKSTGLAIILLSDAFLRLEPDVVLLLGDRFETHAAATTAMLMNIPIAHIHGGEITEGAVDEQIRHSITKMSYLHFASVEQYRQRIIQMGESPERVFCTGAPGLDNILNIPLLNEISLAKELEWEIVHPLAVFTFHSETLSTLGIKEQIEQVLHAIKQSGINVLFTYANADDGGREINQAIEQFALGRPKKYHVVKSLGQLKYLSALKTADLLIGNTSSGIIEAASFYRPVVNIGDRQKGRLQSGNVINCSIDDLGKAIEKSQTIDFIEHCQTVTNIYGEGNATNEIVYQLETHKFSSIKRFHDL